MPETERDILDLFKSLKKESNGGIKALIEHVHGSKLQGAKRAFTFGENFGHLKMAILSCEIPFQEVAPSKWQLLLGCRTAGDKSISKAKAQELFPGVHIINDTAESLLIAEYLRRQEEGTLYDNIEKKVRVDKRPARPKGQSIFDL